MAMAESDFGKSGYPCSCLSASQRRRFRRNRVALAWRNLSGPPGLSAHKKDSTCSELVQRVDVAVWQAISAAEWWGQSRHSACSSLGFDLQALREDVAAKLLPAGGVVGLQASVKAVLGRWHAWSV